MKSTNHENEKENLTMKRYKNYLAGIDRYLMWSTWVLGLGVGEIGLPLCSKRRSAVSSLNSPNS